MKMLIVDDQWATLQAITNNIDWDSEGIEQVFSAQNAMEARLVFKKSVPDIMICDIEMPVESGIDLCRWVREKGHQTKVIFLTCHSEFEYAKEALNLKAVDYILQPAPYEKILDTVHKAISEIKTEAKMEEILSQAKELRISAKYVLRNIWRDYLYGHEECERVIKKSKLQGDGGKYYISILQILSWKEGIEPWDNALILTTIESLMIDIFSKLFDFGIVIPLEAGNYGMVLRIDNNDFNDFKMVENQIRYFYNAFDYFMLCSAAIYIADGEKLINLPEKYNELYLMIEHNVTREAGVFFEFTEKREKNIDFIVAIHSWEAYFYSRDIESVRSEVKNILEQMSAKGELGAEELVIFYQEFMQLIYKLDNDENGVSVSALFSNRESVELYRNGMKSVENMLRLVDYIIDGCKNVSKSIDSLEVVETIKQYINTHLDSNISKEDIIRLVHLNADHVTRVFKKETGLSIKSYIISQKMQTAQKLLKNTSLPISHIAVRLGYSNFSHFSTSYKKYFGRSPMDEKRAYNKI